MNEPVCQLDDFHFRQLSVKWHDPDAPGKVDINHSFDYKVGQHNVEKNRFRLTLRYEAVSNTPKPIGYAVQTEIVGLFRFAEGMPQEKMDFLVRLNGCTILYGILRGQIANLTGVFPQRKLVLPTFMMEEVVDGVEKSKAEKQDAKKSLPASKKPKASKSKTVKA